MRQTVAVPQATFLDGLADVFKTLDLCNIPFHKKYHFDY